MFMGDLNLSFLTDKLAVGVVGEFNAGKSSLINLLIGDRILPTDIFPTTATVNCLIHGRVPQIIINKTDKTRRKFKFNELENFNAEYGDFEDIDFVEIYHPNMIPNLVFIDTPGFNDPDIHRETIVRSILPLCDSILFVSDASQPLKSSEVPFLKSSYTQTLYKRTFFIFNHCDQLDSVEKLKDVKQYTTIQLENLFNEHILNVGNCEEGSWNLEKNIAFTCLDEEYLEYCPHELRNYVKENLQRIYEFLDDLQLQKNLIVEEREIIINIYRDKDELRRIQEKIDMFEAINKDKNMLIQGTIENLEKQIKNIEGFNNNIINYRKKIKEHLDKSRYMAIEKMRLTINNRQLLSNPYFVEIEVKKVLQIVLENMIHGFEQLSLSLLGSSLEAGQLQESDIENIVLDLSALESINRTREEENLNLSSSYSKGQVIGIMGGFLLSTVIGPPGFLFGAIGGQLLPAIEANNFKTKLQASIEQAVEAIIFQVEQVLSFFYNQISLYEERVIEKSREQILKAASEKQWNIIKLYETSINYSEETLKMLQSQKHKIQVQIENSFNVLGRGI